MKGLLVCLMLTVTGCGSLFNSAVKQLPSVQNCQRVEYTRIGNQVELKASCAIPIDDQSILSKAIP